MKKSVRRKDTGTGRSTLPEKIAAAALFQANPASDTINGADLVIDGGYTIL